MIDVSLCTKHQDLFNAEMHHELTDMGWNGEDLEGWLWVQPLWMAIDIQTRAKQISERLLHRDPCEACNMLILLTMGARP